MRLIITRVQPQAQQWVQALCDQGHEAVALPLIETRGLSDVSALQRAWQNISQLPRADVCQCPCGTAFFSMKNRP
jgi:uroporphyrinogen-III synthase